jgi:heptosyltransferase-1
VPTDFRRILLIKPSSLGDIVHTLPTATALKRRFPAASLTWLVKRQWAEVLEGNPALDRILAVDLSVGGWPAAIRAVRAGQFDLVVDLQGLLRSAVLGWLSGASVRVGFANGREGSPWFYTQKVAVVDPEMHAVDRYLLIAGCLGASLPMGSLDFPLAADSGADKKVSEMLLSAGAIAGSPLVAINAGARWPTKQWPPSAFAQVADQLQDKGIRVVVIGSAVENHPANTVVGHMRTSAINLVGRTSIKELIALLRRVRLLITNDSGPMHLATAVGTPVVALFGPTDPIRTGPYGLEHRAIRSGIPCSPCFSRRCVNPKTLECLTSIIPGQVFEEALQVLRKSSQASPEADSLSLEGRGLG